VGAPVDPLHVKPPPTARVPKEEPFPGATNPPAWSVTLPWTVPVPPSVAPLATETALAAASEPFTSSVPELTLVAPV
jgi:hypothetical protein